MANTVAHLDTDALGNYLPQHIQGFQGPITAKKFAGGQSNPTFLLETPSHKYVLRRKPPGELLKSAHAVDREFRVISSLANTDVPVATAYHLCSDETIIGSMFYIMSFEDGRIFWDPALNEIESNATRSSMHKEMINVMAAMHNVDLDAVGLKDYGKPGNYFERQVGRWSQQYRATETRPIPAMERLMDWLPNNMPADDGQVSLIHGDYRLDNVMFHPTEPRAIAVLDWELSTLGHPLADLGYYCMCLRLPSDGSIKGLMNIDRQSLGIPDEAEIVKQYCQLRGLDKIDNWHFYLAFAYFRLAAICQGVFKRAIDGNASNTEALEVGKITEPLAEMGASLIETGATL